MFPQYWNEIQQKCLKMDDKCDSTDSIERINTITYLEIYIDEHMKWNRHFYHTFNDSKQQHWN